MNLTQIVEALPPLVYVRRGELVVQFATPSDLVGRVAELSSVLNQLDQESSRTGETRGRTKPLSRSPGTGGTRGQLDPEPSDGSAGENRPESGADHRGHPA